MLVLGERTGKVGLKMPSITLTDSVPGKTYELHVTTNGVAVDEKQLAIGLIKGLSEKFKAEVRYMSINSGLITIQLEGSPFAWAAVIAWLPSILTIFGLILVGVAVFTVLTAIPSWAWGLLAVGGILILIAPSIGKMIKPR